MKGTKSRVFAPLGDRSPEELVPADNIYRRLQHPSPQVGGSPAISMIENRCIVSHGNDTHGRHRFMYLPRS